MTGYGWKDRTYESIPKAHKASRAYWLTMHHLQRDPQISRDQAQDFAWTQIHAEDHPSFELEA